MLTIIEELEPGILSLPAERLHEQLNGPTLLHLKGKKEEPLFLSVLLHGNENSGWEVAKNILTKYQDTELPRSLSIFIGNIQAAKHQQRRLDQQPDFNRIWENGDSDEHNMIRRVIEDMKQRNVFASIDIHNNNGLNPHYACINRLDKPFLSLARQFSRMVIYFIRPSGVQSLAFSKICPAVTLECGRPGDEYGIQITTRFVDSILELDALETNDSIDQEIDLYHTVGIIKIPKEYSFSFDDEEADIKFIHGIESLNFEEIKQDTMLASLKNGIERPLIALDEDGNDIFERYFKVLDNQIYSDSIIVPAMLTTDKMIVRQDCLCYLMEHYDIRQGEKTLKSTEPVWR